MKSCNKVIVFFVLSTFLFACNRGVTPTKNQSATIGEYEEDLATVRIKYDAKPSTSNNTNTGYNDVIVAKPAVIGSLPMQVNQQVEVVLDSMAVRNKQIRFSSGYRIQVYVGNDRKEVDEAKAYIYQSFPELNAYLTYSQPTYKLKAGDFTSRLDAERYYASIRQRYTAAMIIGEKIDVKKSMQMK